VSAFYPTRDGEFVYDVTVSKDDTALLSCRYRARLANAERIKDGRLQPITVDLPDGYGPTVNDAIRALTTSFKEWREKRPSEG
jgi:hypothetical protein